MCMKLHEMTMKVGSMDGENSPLADYLKHADSEKSDYTHIGDIEDIKVLQKDTVFLLTQDDNSIAFFQVSPQGEILNAFVAKSYRKSGVFTKFLWFMKRTLNYSTIMLGDIHSSDTQEVVKKLHKRFNVFWFNGTEKQRYDPTKTDEYYSHTSPTKWKIILENDGDFSEWPNFFSMLDSRTHYGWL